MKKQSTIIHVSAILALSVTLLSSCGENKAKADKEEESDNKALAEKFNESKSIDSKESKFLVNAADLTIRQIELAKVAENNANSEEIKKMARALQQENTRHLEELKELATEKSITIPTSITGTAEQAREKLDRRSGETFDEEYCEAMVEDHKQAVKHYKSAMEDVDDIDIRNLATKTLPVLRNNLDHALTCQEKYKGGERSAQIKKELNISEDISQQTARSTSGGNSATTKGPDKKEEKKEEKKDDKKNKDSKDKEEK